MCVFLYTFDFCFAFLQFICSNFQHLYCTIWFSYPSLGRYTKLEANKSYQIPLPEQRHCPNEISQRKSCCWWDFLMCFRTFGYVWHGECSRIWNIINLDRFAKWGLLIYPNRNMKHKSTQNEEKKLNWSNMKFDNLQSKRCLSNAKQKTMRKVSAKTKKWTATHTQTSRHHLKV